MPEIKLKHVVSCSTEDTVSQFSSLIMDLCSYSRFSFKHEVKREPSFLSLVVMMQNRLTRQTTCWALTPTESGKQRDPERSKSQSFCRYASALLLPQVSACSGDIMCCFVIFTCRSRSNTSDSNWVSHNLLTTFFFQLKEKKAWIQLSFFLSD